MEAIYRILWCISWPFVNILYPRKVYGRENVPGAGAYLFCANHSSSTDPFLLAYSVGVKNQVHFMAKAELFRIPLVGLLLRAAGMFPVDRKGGGAAAVKGAMKLLKADKKVGMFPEGTRVTAEEESAAKAGAVRLSARMNAPIVPVYIPRNKKPFRRNKIVIGKPYDIGLEKSASSEEFDQAANDLMAKIRELGESVQ